MRQIERVTEAGNDTYLERFGAKREHLADFYYFLADSSLMILQYGSFVDFCQNNITPAFQNGEVVVDKFVDYLADHYSYSDYDRDNLAIETLQGDSMFRQWWYQTCTEVAYYQPAPKLNNIRSVDVTTQWHLDICKHAFGLELGDPTTRTNAYYGNTKVYGPNTFFSNFWQDVWHLQGVTKETPNVPAENIGYINCRDCGHCIDMHSSKESDAQVLKDLRSNEVSFVQKRFDEWKAR